MNNRPFVKGNEIFMWIIVVVFSAGCGGAGCADRCGGPGSKDHSEADGSTNQDAGDFRGDSSPEETRDTDSEDVGGRDRWVRDTGKDCDVFPNVAPCVADLPEPDTPCNREGEIRCSHVGTTVWKYADHPFLCLRPYYVRCEKSQQGELRWVIHKVPFELGGGDFSFYSCQENTRGVFFCPGKWVMKTSFASDLVLCAPEWSDIKICEFSAIRRCDFADNISDEYIRQIYIEPAMAKCPSCVNCLYPWPVERCPDGSFWCTPEEYRSGQWGQPGKCFVDDKCEIQCAKTRYDFCVR